MSSSPVGDASISVRLQNVTSELRQIQNLLKAEQEVDPRVLTDFREAVNRVRNTAWALEQYVNSKTTETDPKPVLTLLAGERVRVAYQFCNLVQDDLANPDVQLQKGPLSRLRDAVQQLAGRLAAVLGE